MHYGFAAVYATLGTVLCMACGGTWADAPPGSEGGQRMKVGLVLAGAMCMFTGVLHAGLLVQGRKEPGASLKNLVVPIPLFLLGLAYTILGGIQLSRVPPSCSANQDGRRTHANVSMDFTDAAGVHTNMNSNAAITASTTSSAAWMAPLERDDFDARIYLMVLGALVVTVFAGGTVALSRHLKQRYMKQQLIAVAAQTGAVVVDPVT